MRQSISGKPAPWTPDIQAKWDKVISEPNMPDGVVTHANYFTPRPYRNEYDRGSKDEGFVYTLNHKDVWIVTNSDN